MTHGLFHPYCEIDKDKKQTIQTKPTMFMERKK